MNDEQIPDTRYVPVRSDNPYAVRLKVAYGRLAKARSNRDRHNANAMPGTFVTGSSGVSRKRIDKLSRQLDKTIDLAKECVAAEKEVAGLEVSARAYDEGRINAQGRAITKKRPEVKKRQANYLRRLMFQVDLWLSIDGVYTLPTGQRISVLLTEIAVENSEHPVGVIQVTNLDGTTENYLTQSMQGVHLEARWREVTKTLLGRAFAAGELTEEGIARFLDAATQ